MKEGRQHREASDVKALGDVLQRIARFGLSTCAIALASFVLFEPVFATAVPPTILSPSVFSYQNTTPTVDGESGALTQHIPIDIPPGRNGLQPILSLDYNSQNTADDSDVGYGWSLSIPYIERLNKTGSENLYSENYFTSSVDGELATTSLTTSQGATVTYLVVGGGGGGGGAYYNDGGAGGGGAGGMATGTANVSNGTSYTVVVGTGGAGGTASGAGTATPGSNGSNSSVNFDSGTVSAIGGGAGGGGGNSSASQSNGMNGGSGGGEGWGGNNPGTGTAGQGNGGGNDGPGGGHLSTGGGGGGAAAVGSNGSSSTGAAGNGGSGSPSSISGTATTYAGGGGGGCYLSSGGTGSGGSGGSGGGGGGSCGSNGTNATANTGGGGGGAGPNGFANLSGGSGGSGVVVISAPISANVTATGGTETQSGGNDIWTFTSSGTWQITGINAASSTPGLAIYAARVDNGAYDIYDYSTSTNSWTMYDKNGDEYLFGASSQSQQSATTSQTASVQTYKWMLEKEIDPNGNYIRYAYSKDHNQIYPSEIIYTGHGSTDGPMTVSFATSTRTDTTIDYLPGFEVDTDYRISQITVAVSSTTVRQYSLSYTTGNNGYRSLLSSVQESGWDDNNVETTLPSWTFAYTSSSTPFVSSASGSSDCSFSGSPYVASEVLGDGLNRSVAVGYNGSSAQVSISNDSSSPVSWPSTNSYFEYSGAVSVCPDETATRLVDVSGNGMANVVQNSFNYVSGTSTYLAYYKNSGGSWSATTTYTGVIPQFYVSAPGYGVAGTTGIFGDVDGTGLPAYEENLNISGYPDVTNGAYLSNGSAWSAATTTIFSPVESFPSSGADCSDSQLVDLTGDGLDDWVWTDGSKTYVDLNNGTGWNSADSRWTISTSTVYESGGNCYDRGWRFVDVNGDGLPDLVRSYTNTGNTTMEGGTYQVVYLNTGHGWATSTAYSLPYIVSASVYASANVISDSELANFLGNGEQYQDVLSTTTNPKGGSTSITYGYTSQSGANPKLPYSLLVVTKVVDHDGRGSNEETDYSYSGGLQYLPSNVYDRKFAGFASVTASTSVASSTTYYSQGSTTTAPIAGDQSDGYGQLNHPYRKDTATPTGTFVQSIFYQYNPIWHGNSEFVGLTRQLEQDYASDGSHLDKDTDYVYSTTTDDLIETMNYGQVTGNSNGTFSTSSQSSLRTTLVSYAASSSINLSVPIEKTLDNSTGATTTDVKYFYDGLAFDQVNIGDQTEEQDWVSGSHYASTTKSYDAYGLVASSTDRDGNVTTYSYDSLNLYPATSTNALSQSTAYTYNYSNGEVERTTDPNGGITKNSYDGIGRLIELDESNPTSPASLLTKTTYAYTDSTSTPSLIHESDYLNAASTTETYDYYDGLDRLIQERKSTETSGTMAVTDRAYNTVGSLASESQPYFSSGTANTTATSAASLYTAYAYDPLGRATSIANAVGTTTNTYAKWTTTTTDPDGHIKDYILDAFGNLAQVVEHNTSSNATTTYSYDAANNLATTTDAAGNIRTFTYDGLGNRLSATDLHVAATSTYGTWTYSYDDQGNEVSRTDPKSQTITHTYDALNRMLTESWTGHGTQIADTYDSCTYGIGLLCTASTSAAADSYAYDALGRAASATTTVQGVGYGLAYGYDRQGNVTSVTNNADGSQLSYTYNAAGLVSSVSRTSGATSSVLALLSNYAPTSQIGNIQFANNASTTYSYAASQLYRLQQILTNSPNATTTVTTTYSVATTSITAYWKLDGNSNDATGNGHNGTDSNITYGAPYGKINQGASFNGSSSSIDSGLSLSTGQSYSATAWVYLTAPPSAGGNSIVWSWDTSPKVFVFTIDNTGLHMQTGYNGVDYSYSFSTGVWYFVAATSYWNGTNYVNNLYLNGVNVGSNSSGGTFGSGSLDTHIGYGKYSGSYQAYFEGDIDEVSIWNRALTSTEVSDLYNSGGGLQYPFPGGTSTTTRDAQLQNLNYTYDPDGNILTRTDSSDIAQGQVVTYAYDTLSRLLSASSTGGVLPSYAQTFTYDALGNILTGPDGVYTYGGSSGADPDAATQLVLTTNASSPTIGYDNSTIAGNGTPVSSLTFSYTVNSNSNGLIIVPVEEATTSPCTSDVVTGVTDNGASLTDASYYVRNTTTVGGALKTYYGFSPTQGTHNVVVTASASCILYAGAETFTGAKQSGFPDASGSGNPLSDSGSVTRFQATTTTANTNAWAVLIGVPSAGGTATAGANTTIRQQQSGNLYFGDSNGPVSPAGSIGLNWTMSAATHWLANYFSITPVVSYPGTQSTTTYSYDLNGNLTQAVQGATTTTYAYDYLNRLATSTVGGVSTTYGYDAFGNRVFQITGNSTTVYPSKWYSVTTIAAATSTGTSTDFVFLPAQTGQSDRLLATVDQPLVNGAPTGSSTIRYVHTDNLGSTQVTSDQNGNLAGWFDYAPYGSVLASTNTGTTTIARQYIGQFSDADGLSYLNARYYAPAQGQFLSEDPIFLGEPAQQNLQDPQSLNAYSYSEDDPITRKDPFGRDPFGDAIFNNTPGGIQNWEVQLAIQAEGDPLEDAAINHPYITGSAPLMTVASVGVPGSEALDALYLSRTAGVGAEFIAQNEMIAATFGTAAIANAVTLPEYFTALAQANSPTSYASVAGQTAVRLLPAAGSILGELTQSLTYSNIGTGASALTSLYDAVEYTGSVLTSITQDNSDQRASSAGLNNWSSSGTAKSGSGSSSGSSEGYSSLPGQFNPFQPH